MSASVPLDGQVDPGNNDNQLIREVIELCLEDEQGHLGSSDFIGVQRIRV